MQVDVDETAPGRFLVVPRGELDIATAPAVDEAVAGVLAHAEVAAVEVDLAEVEFLDSSGIRALLQARRRVVERGGGLTLINPSRPVSLVLRAAALDDVFDIEGDGRPPLEV